MVARDGRLLLRSDAAIVKKAVCSRFAAAYHVLELATDDRVRSNHHIAADVGAVPDDTPLANVRRATDVRPKLYRRARADVDRPLR